jgi:hypothetical protein
VSPWMDAAQLGAYKSCMLPLPHLFLLHMCHPQYSSTATRRRHTQNARPDPTHTQQADKQFRYKCNH